MVENRPSEFELIARHFTRHYGARFGLPDARLSDAMLARLIEGPEP